MKSMLCLLARRFAMLCALTVSLGVATSAQDAGSATAPLREVHAAGFKTLTEAQIVSMTGLQSGRSVGRKELQDGADRLMQSGLFSKVSYNFQTRLGVLVTYQVEETQRIPVYFDNMPWFADSEFADAIRQKIPVFDGTLPDAGGMVDVAADAVRELLASKSLQVTLEHSVIANPIGEGNVQQFHVEGASLRIGKVEFSDPALGVSKVVQQHLANVQGKPYSRMTLDLFLSEAIRPIYFRQGYLHAKLGPPEIRLSGNPNQKLPNDLPVFIPVAAGAVYQWKGIHWHGNEQLSEFTLNGLMEIKTGDVADGMNIEAAWDRIREEFARHGFLDAKLDTIPQFDEQAKKLSYSVEIHEGASYKFGKLVLTGLSLAGERKLKEAWPIATGTTFDKIKFEDFLSKLQLHPALIFGELPVHYDAVGHWLQTDSPTFTVDVLLDFK
jgi:outer membrane protein assembly factor BamA